MRAKTELPISDALVDIGAASLPARISNVASEAEILSHLNERALRGSWENLSHTILTKISPSGSLESLRGLKFFIEEIHPYIHTKEAALKSEEVGRAQRIADTLVRIAIEFGAKIDRIVFVDDVHGIKGPLQLSDAPITSHWRDLSITSSPLTDIGEAPVGENFWSSHSHRTLNGRRIILESELLGGAYLRADTLEGKDLPIRGHERKRIQLSDPDDSVYLWQKNFEHKFPSCDILELQYRDHLRGVAGYSGGVIILPEHYRSQQSRLDRLQKVLSGGDNYKIFSLLI